LLRDIGARAVHRGSGIAWRTIKVRLLLSSWLTLRMRPLDAGRPARWRPIMYQGAIEYRLRPDNRRNLGVGPTSAKVKRSPYLSVASPILVVSPQASLLPTVTSSSLACVPALSLGVSPSRALTGAGNHASWGRGFGTSIGL
jgi:hypothetical protein